MHLCLSTAAGLAGGCLLLLASLNPALAQVTERADCDLALQTATDHYTDGDFEAAIILLEPCYQQIDLPTKLRSEIFRLLILAHLRSGNHGTARALLYHLIEIEPDYQPDPILDPPDLVAFVAQERPVPVPVLPEPDEPQAPLEEPVAGRHWLLTAHLGAGSYGGERGVQRGGLAADFAANAGVSGGLALAVPLRGPLHLGGRLQMHYLPTRFHLGQFGPVELERASSSPWTVAMLAEAMWLFEVSAPVQPGARLGLGAAFSYLNNGLRAGLIVQPGVDLAVPIGPQWRALLKIDLGVVMPGEALDLQDTSFIRPGTRPFDLVTQIGIGLRYHLAR